MQIASEFLSLFAGLERAHGRYVITGKQQNNKVAGQASTIYKPATLDVWSDHLLGQVGLGIVPIRDDATCMWGAIDIDKYDVDLVELEKKCKKNKYPFIVCRTKSGGAHLYVFFKESIEAVKLREKLGEMTVVLGYPGVEIFPKQNNLASEQDAGNWINMPYFNAENTERYAIHKGKQQSVDQFTALAIAGKISPSEFLAIDTSIKEHPLLEGAPPCLRVICEQGVGEGMRNDTLYNLGVYAKMRHGDAWESELYKINSEFFTPPLPFSEFSNIGKSVNRKDYFYACNREPIKSFCNKSACRKCEHGISSGNTQAIIIPDSLQKLLTDPPTWIISVEGSRIECETSQLIEYPKYKKLLVEKLNLMSGPVKSVEWEPVVGNLLESVEEIEAPDDAGIEGTLEHYLDTFCARNMTPDKNSILMGNPWRELDKIWFRSSDFMEYLNSKRANVRQKDVYRILTRRRGLQSDTLSIKGKTTRLWYVPVNDDDEDQEAQDWGTYIGDAQEDF